MTEQAKILAAPETEEALVGAVLTAPEVLDKPNVAAIEPGDFYLRSLGRVWQLISHGVSEIRPNASAGRRREVAADSERRREVVVENERPEGTVDPLRAGGNGQTIDPLSTTLQALPGPGLHRTVYTTLTSRAR